MQEIERGNASSSRQFVHLHLHTTYSLLDGAMRLGRLDNPQKEYGMLNRLIDLGMDTVAVTDHGNMFGIVDFYKRARSAKIKPILGCEVYMAGGDCRDKNPTPQGKRAYHLVLLAQNETGYRNLCKLVTAGHFEGFYYHPRIDKPLLKTYSEGIIGLSACLAGELAQLCILERLDEAIAAAREYGEILDGRFYVELQKNGLALQERVNPMLVEVAKTVGLPLVATNDVHYLTREDAEAQDVLMAIQMRKTMDDPNRLKHEVSEFYLKSPAEMYALFEQWPEACDNTVKIAQQCEVELPLDRHFFPVIKAPDPQIDNQTYLIQLARKGLEQRLKFVAENTPPEKFAQLRTQYEERLEYELKIIAQMGFNDYFLIVADFINWAKDRDIPVGPGRGSAAGSLVAFAMRITDIDPIAHELLFERFLNPERVSMPDIDVDFCEARRDEVIEYVRQRYAVESGPAVSQIITFGTLKAKAVIRDVGRAFNMEYKDVDQIAKLIPDVLNITLKDAIHQEPRLQQLISNNPLIAKVIDIAQRLEGLNRHSSIHAAGVVISDGRPLHEHLPLYKGANDEVVTQFDMSGVESIGLIKFDFLGLKNLTLIKNCLQLIEKSYNQKIDISRIDFESPKTFALLCRGDTIGVFQLESSGMREVMMKLQPSQFDDVIALVALYRPGPLQGGVVDSFINRKHGREEIKYIFPKLEPILKATYGVCIYQEQVMQIANVIANYSLGEADLLRRAMGKKKADEMARQRIRFLDGAKANNYDTNKAAELFDTLEQFAKYGFNRCLTGDTQICDALTGETTTIKHLLDHPRPFHIHAMSDDYTLQIRRVTDVFYNGYKPVFRLTTALGYTIIATANHPFRTTDGWHQLDELQPGRQIAAVGQFPVNLADTAILWDTIQSISPADSADTYDLTVEHDHNFVANGLIAHNSHSAAYGLIAYQNAWLKAHYRCEYMAALLTADSGNSDKILIYLNDCAKYNVEVLPPNINQSQKSFSVVDGKIRFGLSGVKNVGEGAIDAIIEARDLGGHFKSLVDFCERIDLKRVNRRVIESLIKCGAFDNPKITRAAMFEAIEEAIAHGQHFQKEKDSAQFSLFGEAITSTSTYHIPPRAEWLDKEKLACEKNVLGFYISGHPLDRYRADLGNFVSSEIAELHERKNGGIVSIAGIVTSRKDMTTKRGDRMAFVVIEDLTGTIEVSLFPDVFREAAPLLDADQPLLIKGDLECGEQSVKIAAKEVSALSEIRAQRTKEIHLKFKSDQLAKPKFDAMLQTLSKHPGKCTTFIHIEIPSRSHTTIRLPDNIKLTPSETLLEELEIIFGSNPVFMK